MAFGVVFGWWLILPSLSFFFFWGGYFRKIVSYKCGSAKIKYFFLLEFLRILSRSEVPVESVSLG